MTALNYITTEPQCDSCYCVKDDLIEIKGKGMLCGRCVSEWIETACISEIEANKEIFTEEEFIRLTEQQ